MQNAHPDVGVLVGRFQVHDLHEGHRDLIQFVRSRHEKVIIFLGTSPLDASSNNPLDYEARRQMIQTEFPDVNVVYVPDHPSDDAWSKNLDKQIGVLVTPNQSVVLYGGRDSFIEHYSGKFPTEELLQDKFLSGTEVRRDIARSSTKASPEFRAGVIWATQARYPTAFQAVDVAVMRPNTHGDSGPQVLLGRKSTDKLFRFPGGFSDPRSPSLEADARREVAEETGVTIEGLQYVGSTVVDDWRYKYEPDCIKTVLFVAAYVHGRPEPSDDLDAEVRWFAIRDLTDKDIVPVHRPLLDMLTKYLQKGV